MTQTTQDRFGRRLSFLKTLGIDVGWLLIGIAIIGAFGFFSGVPFAAGMLGILPLILGVLCISGLSLAMRGTRRRQADYVLSHVSNAVTLGLPLPAYLKVAIKEGQGPVQKRLVRLNAMIETGSSIARALSQVAGELPLTLLYQINAAERSGTLAESLPRLMKQQHRQNLSAARARADVSYALVLMAIFCGIALMMNIFVMPKFLQIFNDFRLQLPAVSRWLVEGPSIAWLFPAVMRRDRLFYYATVPESPPVMATLCILMLPMMLVVAYLLAGATRGLFISSRRPPLWRGLTDRIAWYAPVFGRLFRNRDAAAVCETMHDALVNGRPLPEAIDIATMPSLNTVLRRRMSDWEFYITQGQSPAAAARASGMPTLLCDLLAGAQSDTAGAIEFAGRAYGSASERLAIVLRAALPVVITAVFAVLVTFLALAMFTPLIALINSPVH